MYIKIPLSKKVNKNKIRPHEGNETFCMAPWTHTYLSPQSERRLCCVSREKSSWYKQYIDSETPDEESKYNPKTLKEHWNSPYMMDIRKKLMRGEYIPECQVCNNKILQYDPYRNYFTKSLFKDKIEEAFQKTTNEGYTEMPPISFDYRVTNLCNFKCRMCGNSLSSAWENEDRKRFSNEINDIRMHWANEENKKTINAFQKEVASAELWEAVNNKTVEEIYWVGGEPLMWPIHWQIMDELIKNGHSKNVTIRYNTNLSKIKYKDIYLYDMLQHFKDIKISASIDGTHEIVEYIRDGIKWEKWLQNFKEGLFLKEKFGQWAIYLDLTMTAPGLFSVKKMIDLAVELDVNTSIKTIFSFDAEVALSPLMIPRRILDPILDDIIEYAKEKAKINSKIEMYVVCFEDIKSKKTFEENYTNWLESVSYGKRNLYELDKYRGDEGKLEKIFSQNKELLEWWQSIAI